MCVIHEYTIIIMVYFHYLSNTRRRRRGRRRSRRRGRRRRRKRRRKKEEKKGKGEKTACQLNNVMHSLSFTRACYLGIRVYLSYSLVFMKNNNNKEVKKVDGSYPELPRSLLHSLVTHTHTQTNTLLSMKVVQ